MTALSLVVAMATAAVSLLRWMRVSQREHYLPRAALLTLNRWLKVRPPNLAVGAGWAVFAFLSIGFSKADPTVATVLGIVAAGLGAAMPIGMPLLGDPKLRFTRRATSQALMAAVLCAVAIAVYAAMDLASAVALAPVFAVFAVDIAAWINRPIERRIAGKFKLQADEKLRRIRPRVVAITGSYGKTTVKNHVRDLVSGSFDTFATPASWNNVAGLSRAINERMPPTTEVFVAEMGTYGPGEIAEMTAWLKPEVAVITAIGPVHLERMKSLEGITEAKAEILDGARAAVLCVDSPHLSELADGLSQEVWRVGTDLDAADLDVVAFDDSDNTITVFLKGELLGEIPHGTLHASNVACAVGAAAALSVDRRVLAAGLSKLGGSASRLAVAVAEDGVTVVDDTFNSNPTGAQAALAALTEAVPDGRRFVVTPGMVELGDMQHDENRRFAEAVKASGAELVVVGWTNRKSLLTGYSDAATVPNREAARTWLRDHLTPGDGVLWENDLPDQYP